MSVSCVYYAVTTENASPLGSGEYWPMTSYDCLFEPEDEDLIKQFEEYGSCDEGCPGYQPVPTGYCSKHGTYELPHGCEECMVEAMYGDDLRQEMLHA